MQKIRTQRGQGLIEMLLVVLFIAMGVIALVKFQNYLSYSSDIAQQQNDATILGVKQLETLRDFTVLAAQSGYNAYASIASGNSTATVGNATYTLTWTVTTNASPSYKTLDITVSWTDRFNGSQSIRLVTNVAGIDPATSAKIM